MPSLTAYLERIGYTGRTRPDLETLSAITRAHLAAIPFENLDVQLAKPGGAAVDAVFDKIVARRRGGWCYEMNTLMGWALRSIGFDVTRMAGGVMRATGGDKQIGNHLCLLVRLDQPYLVDVGFGGSLASPLPLAAGERLDRPFRVQLSQTGDGFWRFEEQAHGASFSFDFTTDAADEALLDEKRRFLERDPASPFVQNLLLQKRDGERHLTLRGRVLGSTDADGAQRRVIGSAAELVSTLHDGFGLDAPEAESLWPSICARHAALFPQAS